MSFALEIDGPPPHLGAPWSETTVTDHYRMALHPGVRSIAFTSYQENEIGADILVWFIDSATDEAFGVLLQAKNLRRTEAGAFSIDFGYDDGEQLRRLLQTGDDLDVPSGYLIYAGPGKYRSGLSQDLLAEELAVSVLPALVALRVSTTSHPEAVAEDAMRHSRPMESLVTTASDAFMLLGLDQANAELVDFLRDEQAGVRCIAKEILRILAQIRIGDLSAVLEKAQSTPVFANVPMDPGHFGVSYVLHVLRGLRKNLPHYASVALDQLGDEQRIEIVSLTELDPQISLTVAELWLVTL